ncbi:MAG TPA: hypothetical protein PLB18_22515, partial [Acidobacteriota bacterium]|nr:hypothetical protein [Acidobacteriota bacterium]
DPCQENSSKGCLTGQNLMPKIHVLENGFQNLLSSSWLPDVELWLKRNAAKNIKREKPAKAVPLHNV